MYPDNYLLPDSIEAIMRQGQKLMLEDAEYVPVKMNLKRYSPRGLEYRDCYVLYDRYGLLDDLGFLIVPFD